MRRIPQSSNESSNGSGNQLSSGAVMHTARTLRPYAAVAVASAAALLLSACGGSGSGSPASDVQSNGTGQQGQSTRGGQVGRAPGTFGLVAQISGTTLQVQSADAQTAVTYSPATTFSQTVSTSKSAVKVGDCVVVRSETGTASGSLSATGSPTAPPTQPSAVTAASVDVSAATGGQCAGGGFGGFGGGPGAGQGQRGGGQRTFAAATFGQVTSVSGTGFVVSAETFAGRGSGTPGSTATTRPSASPTFTTRPVTVTTSSSTTYTTAKAATAKALAVGKCVAARGQADDTGAVAATSIAISPADNGQCTVQGF
jgi:hypothetical protein